MVKIQSVDITPSPKILRVLGDIPFEPWQCIAELVDNSIDAYLSGDLKGNVSEDRNITVSWSKDNVASHDRTLEVRDSAKGMTLDQLRNAVRAGYSSNNPVSNLGLFGMGFNIATARLGDTTEVFSSRQGDNDWVGIRIDFDELNKTEGFKAPVRYLPKDDKNEHGTFIVISNLKSGIQEKLSKQGSEIRRMLQKVYAPVLRNNNINNNITIIVNGKKLIPQDHCVWAQSRYVIHNNEPVPAVIKIDEVIGTSFFNLEKNRYLTEEEVDNINSKRQKGESTPSYIIPREKRITGWIGIQRYADPDDFGLDLIRNGRKILMSDKTFFFYNNPQTNTRLLQYPVELGSTVGGRIVGELNVDFLIPTYQKNDFDRTDLSWGQLLDVICGNGPYLPKTRKALGITDPIEAPIPKLVNAYRRVDPGTRCLYIPSDISKQFLKEFCNGNSKYQTDELWYKVAQEEDQKRKNGGNTTDVNAGSEVLDEIEDYLPITDNEKNSDSKKSSKLSKNHSTVKKPIINTTKEELLERSEMIISLSGQYSFGKLSPFSVQSYKLSSGMINIEGESCPCFFDNEGVECIFIYNPRHDAFTQYPLTPKGLLLQYLAERIKVRDPMSSPDIVNIYFKLAVEMMSESKIDKISLQEKADQFFKLLAEKLSDALNEKKTEVLDCIHEASGEVEDTIRALYPNSKLIKAFQNKNDEGYFVLDKVPCRTLVRLVERFPEMIFDNKVLNFPFESILIKGDEKATARTRNEAKDRALSYMKDALRIVSVNNNTSKAELSRLSISIDFLMEALEK